MEIAAACIAQLLSCMSPSVARRWDNHRSLYKNVEKLRQSYEELNCRKRDIESRLVSDHIEGETEWKSEVGNWLSCVHSIGRQVDYIEENVRYVKFFSRARFVKFVNKVIEEVAEIFPKGVFPDGLVIQLPRRGYEKPAMSILGGETTFQKKMEEIWECLLDKEVSKIGVYGMGGIGKTTALERTNNRLLEDPKNDFRAVIWVTVAKDCGIRHLQDKIAKKLDLDLSKDDDVGNRAVQLHEMLKKKKRFALILDDVWEVYNLQEVGIPEPTSENGCKIVVSTRSREVCHGMSCDPLIEMECMSDSEALSLFAKVVGSNALNVSNLEAIIKDVARECAGLPLAIVVVAGSLKGVDDINEWENALEELRDHSKAESTYDRIFDRLKFSYDRLNDKRVQDCLLYCAMYPEDERIERELLIDHLMAEGIVEERKTRQSQIRSGHIMLNKLVNACLLNNIRNIAEEKCVIMHDLVRDMALQITSGSPRYLIRSGVGLRHVPDEGNWDDDVVKVSLMDNINLSSIPSEIEPKKCLRLSTLLLQHNTILKEISNSFLIHMTMLSVLDLSGTGIEYLPQSISNLTALTALFLRYCHRLINVPSLAKLTNLRLLDLSYSSIKQVPHGLEMLTKLRYLNLSYTELESMLSEILCNLVDLQFLSLIGSSLKIFRSPKGISEDLKNLSKLETIEAALYEIDNWNEFVRYCDSRKLASYMLRLGSGGPAEPEFHQFDKVVYLPCFGIATSSECPLLLPEDVEVLVINRCNLEELSLQSCKMEIGCEEDGVCSDDGNEDKGKGKMLMEIRCEEEGECSEDGNEDKGKGQAVNMITLPKLKEIECEEEGICSEDGNEDKGKGQAVKMISLPKLKRLYLWELPNLLSLPLIADSLEQIDIRECGKLRKLPIIDRQPIPSSLQRVKIDRMTWSLLEWDHPDAKKSVEELVLFHY